MSHSSHHHSTLPRYTTLTQSANLKHIGVYTSGGDAPGMNAAIRAVVRTALHHGIRVTGITHGYRGLHGGAQKHAWLALDSRSMGNILQSGGTFLKTARLPEFSNSDVRTQTAQTIRQAGLDALVCIGGDGSFQGAHLLWKEHGIPIVGIPGTIDNDIAGTDATIGFDTAVNTAVQAIDRIRDTADSHERLFIVEVMGRDSGFIALETGLAGGAEEIFFADNPVTVDEAIQHIRQGLASGKRSSILVTVEGQKPGRAYDLAESIRKKSGFEAKVCVLGHVLRGGAPTVFDRNLASRMGAGAVALLQQGYCDAMMTWTHGQVSPAPFEPNLGRRKRVEPAWIRLAQTLSY
ncbi:MAG: 6-phosphofructokinase [Bdellovibrionales bacterium]|jgi:6-phosphofructokinase 1|nr:6-phosphofructokinase [Bdellovibrionales bacterium]